MKREDAIKLLIPMRVVDGERSVAIDMAIADMEEMDRLSKATPVLKEPPRQVGVWIDEVIIGCIENVTCSVCNKDFPHADEYPLHTPFCPWCGSKMKWKGL